MNEILLEMTHKMLSSTDMARRSLANALNTMRYLMNRSLSSQLDVGLLKKCGHVTLFIVLLLEHFVAYVIFKRVMITRWKVHVPRLCTM